MGVHGLWQLLQSTGKTVSLESLEGKVLAVDVSIWLHQAIKGMRGKDGHTLPNAHLQVLFNRVCKLLYYRIKPVFVFDGGVPVLKKQTLASRRERKELASNESEKTSKKLLENLMRAQAVKEVLTGEANTDVKPVKLKNRAKDLFELPPLPDEFKSFDKDDSWEEKTQTQMMIQEELEENEDIDTTSTDFQSLPSELKHEILTELKERTKHTSWAKIHELPEEAGDFASYQLKKLLKKGKLTHQLDAVRKELNTRSTCLVTPGLSDDFYSEEIQSQRVVSTDTSRYVLIKGIGRKKQEELAKAHVQEKANITDQQKKDTDIDTTKEIKEKGLLLDSSDKDEVKGIKGKQTSNKKSRIQTESNSKGNVSVKTKTSVEESLNSSISNEDLHRKPHLDDVINMSDDVSSVNNDVIIVDDEPKPSTSGLCVQSHKIGNDILSDEESDDGLSQQEILTMIKNENVKSGYSRETKFDLNISDEDSDDTCESLENPLKERKESPLKEKNSAIKVNEKDNASYVKSNIIHTLGNKLSGKESDVMEITITERKRRLSLEPDICIDEKKQKFSKKNSDEIEQTVTEGDKMSEKGDNVNSSVITIEDDESEDEGFIEVAIDPNKAQPDELFPEDIFTVSSKDLQSPSSSSSQGQNLAHESRNNSNIVNDELKGETTLLESELTEKAEDEHADLQMSLNSVTDEIKEGTNQRNIAKEFADLSELDLQEMQNELESESRTLQTEMSRQERMATSITDEMFTEAQALLKIFGLPYIVSPMEAEAQCAQLDRLDLTQGTITDDSDVWLFGGKRVYKNFYQKDKHVEFYTHVSIQSQLVSPMEAEAQCAQLDRLDLTQGTITDDSDVWLFGGKRVYKNFYQKDKHVEFYTHVSIQSQLGLDRQLLINIALLCGSDYTDGIQGVGPVKAMEIMTEFPGHGIRGLEYFRDWWEECQTQPKFPHEPKIRSQLRKLDVKSGFPNSAVVDAYMNPAVDDSEEPLSWSKPDLYQLREFAREKLGWTKDKIDEILLPVMKRLNEQDFQSRIHMYFQPENFVKPAKVKSKRLKNALDKFVAPDNQSKNDTSGNSLKDPELDKGNSVGKSKKKGEQKTNSESEPKNNSKSEPKAKKESKSEEYLKLAKLTCEIEEFKSRNKMDNSNEAKLQRVRERLGIKTPKVKMPKGRGQGRGRGRGKTASITTDSDIVVSTTNPGNRKIKDEIDLSESSESSGDELIANLDLDAVLESVDIKTTEKQVPTKSVKREAGGFIIDEDNDDSDYNTENKRSKNKGKGKGKSSYRRGQSSTRGNVFTSSLRNKSTRTSKTKAESEMSKIRMLESDSDSD